MHACGAPRLPPGGPRLWAPKLAGGRGHNARAPRPAAPFRGLLRRPGAPPRAPSGWRPSVVWSAGRWPRAPPPGRMPGGAARGPLRGAAGSLGGAQPGAEHLVVLAHVVCRGGRGVGGGGGGVRVGRGVGRPASWVGGARQRTSRGGDCGSWAGAASPGSRPAQAQHSRRSRRSEINSDAEGLGDGKVDSKNTPHEDEQTKQGGGTGEPSSPESVIMVL